jgi:hypothetical protein
MFGIRGGHDQTGHPPSLAVTAKLRMMSLTRSFPSVAGFTERESLAVKRLRGRTLYECFRSDAATQAG